MEWPLLTAPHQPQALVRGGLGFAGLWCRAGGGWPPLGIRSEVSEQGLQPLFWIPQKHTMAL